MNKRIEFFDVAKGISILLVVLIHNDIKHFLFDTVEYLLSFKQPLFFFLSGVFFSFRASFVEFFIKKFDALMKPYFFTLIVLFVVKAFFVDNIIFGKLVYIFYGTGGGVKWLPMWFLPHLFAIFVFSYVLNRAFNFHILSLFIKLIILALFVFLGAIAIKFFYYIQFSFMPSDFKFLGLPYSVDLILIGGGFFLAGSVLKREVVGFKPSMLFFSFSVLGFFLIYFFTDAKIDLYKRIYSEVFFSTLHAVFGVYIVLCISYWIAERGGALKYFWSTIGSSSLFILIFHYPICIYFYSYFSVFNEAVGYKFLIALVSFFLSVALPLVIEKIIRKSRFLSFFYLPIKKS